ncbi:MAG: DUF1015 domain-containing protein [Candidatus Margulisiibacteriota bacterium]
MLNITPFKALRYNPESTDLASVLAPPYDVISATEQAELYAQNPHNVVRLILGLQHLEDTPTNNRYTRSKADLEAWKKDGVLVQEETPGFYLYEHTYTLGGQTHSLKGMVARMTLAPLDAGVILPHENTLSGPITDRLELTKACQCNFSQIFTLFSDEHNVFLKLTGEVFASSPLYDVQTQSGRYRIWKVGEASVISQLQQFFKDRVLFIADGHHRYTTALAYQQYVKDNGLTDVDADSTMIFMSNLFDPGLQLYPTHRICFDLPDFNEGHFLDLAHPYFNIESHPDLPSLEAAVAESGQHLKTIGVVFSANRYLLKLKPAADVSAFFPQEASQTLRHLDVSILHKIILQGLLKISEEDIKNYTRLRYIKDAQDVYKAVKQGDAQVGFILNPTKIEEMRDISINKEKMPQKSTYFYPKLITGLVINSLRKD